MRLQLLLMQLLLCVLPGMEMGASCRLTAWVVEDSSGKVEITCIGDTMDIVSPDGLSLWYKERLTGMRLPTGYKWWLRMVATTVSAT